MPVSNTFIQLCTPVRQYIPFLPRNDRSKSITRASPLPSSRHCTATAVRIGTAPQLQHEWAQHRNCDLALLFRHPCRIEAVIIVLHTHTHTHTRIHVCAYAHACTHGLVRSQLLACKRLTAKAMCIYLAVLLSRCSRGKLFRNCSTGSVSFFFTFCTPWLELR